MVPAMISSVLLAATNDFTSTATAFALLTGLFSIGVALWLTRLVLRADTGTSKMVEIATAIQEGAGAFLRAEFRALSVFVLVVAILLGISVDWETAFCFIVGAACSATTGYIGMSIAVRANVRTAAAARRGLNPALRVAYNSGSVMALSVVGVGLVGLVLMWYILENIDALAGFGFGASSIALFARVGGGIFTKAADVGADLVGKVEQGIPEDDPRNPATIADNVGDNVGDVAGMGADLFESYVGGIVAAATLGQTDDQTSLPLFIAGIGILSSVIGNLFVRTKEGATQEDLLAALRRGVIVASILVLAGTLVACLSLDIEHTDSNGKALVKDTEIYLCIVIGLAAGVAVGSITEFYTSFAFWPTQSISKAAVTGPATVIIQGIAVGTESTVLPVLVIVAGTLGAVKLGGLYGVAIAAVGMLSTLGVTLATDAYGPVADNAGGIAEMAELPPEVRDRTDALDALGNTTAATGKGFAIGSAVLTSLALMAAFRDAAFGKTGDRGIDLVDKEEVIPGLLVGAMLPFLFASFTMTAVGKAAMSIIEEVRRQFHEKPGIMTGEERPDHAKCVAISTQSSLRFMVMPGLMAVVAPILVGLTLGREALAGMLTGAISAGFLLALTMANAGGAWDNAKKFVEKGHLGGKGSEAHKATVVGDTVGDPFKDTSGPSLNILIKLMSVISLVTGSIYKDVSKGFQVMGWIILALIVCGGIFALYKKNKRETAPQYSELEEGPGGELSGTVSNEE